MADPRTRSRTLITTLAQIPLPAMTPQPSTHQRCTSTAVTKIGFFTDDQLGAENWAAIASLVETCKMLDIEPYAYLCDVLVRIITRADTDPINDLLPYNWVDTNARQTVFEMSDIASAA